MKVRYVGGYRPGLDIPSLSQYAAHNETIDVPKAEAEELIERGDFESANSHVVTPNPKSADAAKE